MAKKSKPDRAMLARVDARTVTREIDWAMGDLDYFRDWRNQIEYYRQQAEQMPDQRRSTPIWTPVHEIAPKWREQLADAPQKEIDGTLHYATGWKATPRARLEAQIHDAEKAATAGDLGRFGLHIAAIVTTLHNAALPTIQQAQQRERQSKAGKAPRPSRRGTLRRVLDAMDYTGADDAIRQWKKQPKIGGYSLRFTPENDKPFSANGEAFSEKQIRQKVSAIKSPKK